MPSIFSNHYNSSGTVAPGEGALAEELPFDRDKVSAPGRGHSRIRRSCATVLVGTVAGIGDEIRMFTLKSGDFLYSLKFSSNAGATAGDADLGVYEAGTSGNHDGDVIDVDLFSTTAEATDTEHLGVEVWAGGALAIDEDMGKPLWELCAVGAASYTVDPMIDIDFVFTPTVAFTVAVTRLTLEAYYTSGDN